MRRIQRPVRWWVRFYTAGLPSRIRDERRAEIESDLWEQWRSSNDDGSDRVRLAVSVWSRWLLGVLDDVTWTAEQRTRARRRSRTREDPSLGPARGADRRLLRIGAGVTVALALLALIVIVNTIHYYDGTQPVGSVASVMLALAATMAILGSVMAVRGFLIMRARPAEGALIVVGGSFVAGLAWYWLFVPVLLAIAASGYGIMRAVRLNEAKSDP